MKKNQSVLIVDDAEINIDILMGILKNYDVIPALSGQDALQIVEEENIDIILLDIMMPDMDGYEVCKRLKKNERTKNIPIIFITVKNMEQDILRGYELGIVDYITKPFNAVELIGKVKTHLDLKTCQINLEQQINEQNLNNSINRQFCQDLILYIKNNFKQNILKLETFNSNIKDKIEKNKTFVSEEVRKECEKSEIVISEILQTIGDFQELYKNM